MSSHGALDGYSGTRPRLGLIVNSPVADAGMREELPPSLDCENGTIPDATAAAAPPLDPPQEWSGFQGLRHGP